MRINSLELSWFRGAPESASIDTRDRSCVIYGDTASGKSSFVDGFEYLLNRGRIEHVSCEYADRSGQRNCVRNTTAPDNVDAKTTVTFVGGESIYAIIPHDDSITYGESTDGLLEQFQKWKRPSHILRQDEVADFIEKTKGQKYSALMPLLGLTKYEDIFRNFEGLEQAIVERSGLDSIKARRNWIKEELENKVGLLEQDKIIATFKEKGTSYGVSYTDLDASSETAVTKVVRV